MNSSVQPGISSTVSGVKEQRERLKQMKSGYTPKNIRAFVARFERDNARDMTPEQWGLWVNSLPIPEFMAMCCMTTEQVKLAIAASGTTEPQVSPGIDPK